MQSALGESVLDESEKVIESPCPTSRFTAVVPEVTRRPRLSLVCDRSYDAHHPTIYDWP